MSYLPDHRAHSKQAFKQVSELAPVRHSTTPAAELYACVPLLFFDSSGTSRHLRTGLPLHTRSQSKQPKKPQVIQYTCLSSHFPIKSSKADRSPSRCDERCRRKRVVLSAFYKKFLPHTCPQQRKHRNAKVSKTASLHILPLTEPEPYAY